MEVNKKLCIVWNCSRRISKYCLAATLKDLMVTGSEALEIDLSVNKVRVTFNNCGADLEDERFFQALPSLCKFMLLTEEQTWPGAPPEEAKWARKQKETAAKPVEYLANNILRELFEKKVYELLLHLLLTVLEPMELEELVDNEHLEDIAEFVENFQEIQPIAYVMSENYDMRCITLLKEKKGSKLPVAIVDSRF